MINAASVKDRQRNYAVKNKKKVSFADAIKRIRNFLVFIIVSI